jgi:hypothetical protein
LFFWAENALLKIVRNFGIVPGAEINEGLVNGVAALFVVGHANDVYFKNAADMLLMENINDSLLVRPLDENARNH